MKILHISDSYNGGGAESVFRDTILATEQLGYEVEYFISNGKITPISYTFSIEYYLKLQGKLNFLKPEIIHIHNYYHFLTPSILLAIKKYKQKNQCKVIFTAHDYHFICPNSGFQFFNKNVRRNFDINKKNINFLKKFDHRTWFHSYLKVFQFVLNYKILKLRNVIDVIISPSEFLKNVFKEYNIKQPIYVIRNPIELKKQDIKKIKQNKNKIVMVGRLSPEKGFIEFINKVNNEVNFYLEIHIYGTGELEEKIKEIKLKSNIKIFMHGYIERENLIKELNKYDLFVLPSVWYENAPISIIEAGAAGLPILVPSYGGLIEMANLTETRYTFKYTEKNLEEILKKILFLEKNNKIPNEDIFSFKNYKEKLKEIYEL